MVCLNVIVNFLVWKVMGKTGCFLSMENLLIKEVIGYCVFLGREFVFAMI